MKLFVPGRICLFGEHSDWAGGYRRLNPELEKGHALIVGTDQGIRAAVGPHPDSLVLTSVLEEAGTQPHVVPMDGDALLREALEGGFWSYVAGVALRILQKRSTGGLVLDNYAMDLPPQKGLSSSAAVCVLTARAFNRLYSLGLTTEEEMEIAYQGEIATPSRCGRMDQGCAFGRRPIRMTFDGDSLEVSEIRPGGDVFLLIVDLKASKASKNL